MTRAQSDRLELLAFILIPTLILFVICGSAPRWHWP